MRLLFWNTYCENSDSGRITSCLDALSPDVVVMCEATEGHLEAVARRYRHVVQARDYLQDGVLCHVAIAAQVPLSDISVVRHGEINKAPASWLARRMGWVEFLDTLAASLPALGFRVLCLHLSAGCGPMRRRRELEAAAEQISLEGPMVVAGDFNSFSEPWLAPILAAPLGYTWRDWGWRERSANDAWFAERGFTPAIDGITFPRFQLRMDQIYVRDVTLTTGGAVSELWGSDHRPVMITLST